MAQAVSRRLLTAVARVRSQASPCEIGGGQSDTLTGFSPSSSVSLVSIVPPVLDTHLHLRVASYREDKRGKARNSCVRLNVWFLYGKLEDRIFSAEWYRPFHAISLVRF